MFEKELEFFVSNQNELVKRYKGRVLVIKGQDVIGVYDTALAAYIETQKEHPLGTFMIQPCEPGSEAYTVTINSNRIVWC